MRQALQARWPDCDLLPRPLLRPGSWIGGDRDGNPFVDAASLELAVHRHAATALGHYLEEIDRLGVELSMSIRLVRPTPALLALAEAAGTVDLQRRRALPAGAAGHPRPRWRRPRPRVLGEVPGVHRPHADLPPYGSPADLRADLDAVDTSLRGHGAAALADDRLARLRRAVDVFGFHLAGLDLRQNSAVHEHVVADLLRWAGVTADYLALDEPERVEILASELRTRRPLVAADADLDPRTGDELAVVRAAAGAIADLGPEAVPNYVISRCESVSDVLEVALLLKEVGLVHAGDQADLRPGIVPLFETIDDLRGAGATMAELLALPRYRALLRSRGRRAGGDARVLRLEQGRRVPGGQLGALPGRGRPRRGVPGRRRAAAAVPRPGRHGRAGAAGRATRRSSPSPRAACAARCA